MAEQPLLKVDDLSVCYHPDSLDAVPAVHNVCFSLEPGASLGIIGESGSGKTSIALAVMGLLDRYTRVTGQIYCGCTNLQGLLEKELNQYRWRKVALVFQNSLDVLNPVLTVHEQIAECLKRHTELKKQEITPKILQLLELVGLDPAWAKGYPHQLSGGMRQRVLVAMALACDPEILIVDEPTTALDAIAKSEIIELLARLQREKRFALVVISHEMPTIARLTTRLMVMYRGQVVEEGLTKDILKNPMHTYTRGLLNASPTLNPHRDLWGIPSQIHDHGPAGDDANGCPFYARCNQRQAECARQRPALEYVAVERKVACNRGGIATLLQGRGVGKQYRVGNHTIQACADCNLTIRSGEVAVLIGASGSGKTTLASMVAGILPADQGEILFEQQPVRGHSATSRKRGIQIVFQDPFSATNEQFSVAQAVREPLDILKLGTVSQRHTQVVQALQDVQLPTDEMFLAQPCFRLSGGQRQRVALARALVMEPKLLIADEISSMLDPSTQANILRLLKGLQNSKGFAMLYITHDLALAQKIADQVYVMCQGRIVEKGSPVDIFAHPADGYTKKLVQSALHCVT